MELGHWVQVEQEKQQADRKEEGRGMHWVLCTEGRQHGAG